MKVYYGKWWISFDWDKHPEYDMYRKYISPFNWLSKDARYWGYDDNWYDGPHPSFGFWFFNVNWSYGWWRLK